jgi:hypothetical protein
MATSIFLAKLLGPILLLAAVAVFVNRKAIDALAREVLDGHALLLLLGFLDFTAGLAIVLTHNVWVANWRVIITLLGWLLLVRGVVRSVIPDQVRPYGLKLLRNPNFINGVVAVMLVLGLVLSYFGYAR